ncbi:MAG: hypothetical protein WCD89_17010 [Anaerocolumna sp.]
MDSIKIRLKKITQILLGSEDNYGIIKKASDELYDLFIEISEVDEEGELNKIDYILPDGKVKDTIWASMCMKEFIRTKRFISGIYKAIKQAQLHFPKVPIYILYAGTGPFGVLLITLTSMFTSKDIRITMLEMNKDSVSCLKKVIHALEVEAYIEEIITCDAACYKVNPLKPIHMVVAETMQNGLKKKPQVAITRNLVPQMVKGGILIPEHISIDAVLFDYKKYMEWMMGDEGAEKEFYYPLKTIFNLDKESVLDEDLFDELYANLPEIMEDRYKKVCLFTKIQVFGTETLTFQQSSLNLPLQILDIEGRKDSGSQVSHWYQTKSFLFNWEYLFD